MLTATYTYNSALSYVTLTSDNISDLILNTADYTKIKITVTRNCCTTDQKVIEAETPFTSDGTWALAPQGIFILPTLFGDSTTTQFIDGVYKFEVKLFKADNTYTYEENCIFIDVTMRCKVASLLKDLLEKSEDGECATNAHILHYALVNGSGCGCNCDEMCKVFKELYSIVSPLTPQNTGCGC